ncbi:hypothetical protein BV22DRAFT_482999 [Leucogyrophana mollusca]|uniref:Uncharacterized protein n=1 Tax=Leucogyrophana mollusca TaxID=85980 RepID=A0ACB8BHP0_9AGAM|nr:hypothetical protein BV22DRAFT_482999 [Leucogyrophana mollusca]
MEPSGLSAADEQRLREHVRRLLFGYAKTHLTVDYTQFTEDALEQLLSQSLCFVPMADANSLVLPPDPFDTLLHSLEYSSLKPYDDRWATDTDSVQLIKRTLNLTSKSRGESCWHEDDPYEQYIALHRPMSPVLTSRARRETPKPGSGVAIASIPRSKHDVLDLIKIKPVENEPMAEPPSPKLDDFLNPRLTIDKATHGSMVALVKSIPTLCPPPNEGYLNPAINAFLRCDSPPPLRLRCQSPPLFARSKLPGNKQHASTEDSARSGLDSFADLPAILPPERVDDDDEADLNTEHMLVVDGWVAYVPISSPAVSSASSCSEIDQLFDLSPPGTPATSLLAAKMEEIEVPRVRKSGMGRGPAPSLIDGKRYTTHRVANWLNLTFLGI